jgi:histidinol-phosphate/aromatic aminotransferase/cobyric acid decarboxylase-like protein/choline kinase
MQAIILAAGYGRRMRPLSDTCHKALLSVGGRTILSRIVSELLTLDVSMVNVVTGYQAADVKEHLTVEYPGAPLRFIHNERFAETNNIVSLALALDSLERGHDVVLVECDLVLAPGILARVCGASSSNVALVDTYRVGMDGTVVTVADGLLTAVFPPAAQGEQFEYRDTYKTLNVYRFSDRCVRETLKPLVTTHAEQVDATAYYEAVLATLPDLAALGIEAAVVAGEAWAEIDDPTDLLAAQFCFAPEERVNILDRTIGTWAFDVLDFSTARNAYYPTPAVLAAIRHALADLIGGYGSASAVLDEKLGWLLGCQPDRIEALHGGAQALPILDQLWRDRRVALPVPTIPEYCRVFGTATSYRDAPGIDLKALDRLASEVDVLVVANPNYPTGTSLPTDALHCLATRHPTTIVLVDESFIAFSAEVSIRKALEVEPLPNVVVLTSLDAELGVPGLGLGYVYSCDRDLLSEIANALPTRNLGSVAEYLLELTLKFRSDLERSIRCTVDDREALRRDLLEIPGIAFVHPSGGNFLLLELVGHADVAAAMRMRLLAEQAIEVQDVTRWFGDGVPRLCIAVHRRLENARLLRPLQAGLEAVHTNHGADWAYRAAVDDR